MTPTRLAGLDVARGVALVAMFGYHLAWDLSFFNAIPADFPYSLGMRAFSHAIAATFLFLSGVSLALGQSRQRDRKKFWTRFFKISSAAVIVTAVSFAFDPSAPILFGILHCIAFGALIAAPLLKYPWPTALSAAVVLFCAPYFYSSPMFNANALNWTGLQTINPHSADFRPLAPWAGALLAGVAFALSPSGRLSLIRVSGWRAKNFVSKILIGLGQKSLVLYLIHQPVFLGALFVASYAIDQGARMDQGASMDQGARMGEEAYIKQCIKSDLNASKTSKASRAACRCLWREMSNFQLQDKLVSGLNQDEAILVEEIQKICANSLR